MHPADRRRTASGPYYGGGLVRVEAAYEESGQKPRQGPVQTPQRPFGSDFGAFLFWVRLLLVVAWAGVLVTSLVWRLAVDEFEDYASHLTNWAWTVAALFYTIDALSHFEPTGRLALINILVFFWMTFGLSWVVFWLMFLVLKENPDILLEASDRAGGDLPLGTVFDGDRLLHVLPALINVLYVIVARSMVLESVNQMAGPSAPPVIRALYWLYAPLFSPCAPVLIYLATFSPQVIYGITSSNWVLFAIGFGSVLLLNALPFLGFSIKAWHDRRPPILT